MLYSQIDPLFMPFLSVPRTLNNSSQQTPMADKLLINRILPFGLKLEETDEGYKVRFMAVGIAKENISIEVVDDHLNVVSKTNAEQIQTKTSFSIPPLLDRSTIAAKLDMGILEISAKKKAGNQNQKIEIKIS